MFGRCRSRHWWRCSPGLVISLQFADLLAKFGVQHTVGKVVILTLFRELGPVLTALTVGARIGSGITAELGSMKVTEQIDAISALGADPLRSSSRHGSSRAPS